ncbi:MAG: DUF933 domain-containing protein [Chitinispirillaceae bacterium]|nr:DUF933 domain-containing protein [Chitinispirillaceae bacterium]
MKIGYHGVAVPEGKVKYGDPRMRLLVEKCKPKKTSPHYVEFIKDEYVQCDVILIAKELILDLLIHDMEKTEGRFERSHDPEEKTLLRKCLHALEAEQPLCDCAWSDGERAMLAPMNMLSVKPVIMDHGGNSVDHMIEACLEKAAIVFFYTAGPKEVHAWPVAKDADIVTCAGKIHTDLARGFIKGDVARFDDFMSCHNWNDCQKKGLVKVVERDYAIRPGDVIEIRFAV